MQGTQGDSVRLQNEETDLPVAALSQDMTLVNVNMLPSSSGASGKESAQQTESSSGEVRPVFLLIISVGLCCNIGHLCV